MILRSRKPEAESGPYYRGPGGRFLFCHVPECTRSLWATRGDIGRGLDVVPDVLNRRKTWHIRTGRFEGWKHPNGDPVYLCDSCRAAVDLARAIRSKSPDWRPPPYGYAGRTFRDGYPIRVFDGRRRGLYGDGDELFCHCPSCPAAYFTSAGVCARGWTKLRREFVDCYLEYTRERFPDGVHLSGDDVYFCNVCRAAIRLADMVQGRVDYDL